MENETDVNPTDLAPHQLRVKAEKEELDDKIRKLTTFTGGKIFPTLDKAEQDRLLTQLAHMKAYSDVLGERFAAFWVRH